MALIIYGCVFREAHLQIFDILLIQCRLLLGPWLGLHIEGILLEALLILVDRGCRLAALLEHMAHAVMVPFVVALGVAPPEEHAAGAAEGPALAVAKRS